MHCEAADGTPVAIACEQTRVPRGGRDSTQEQP